MERPENELYINLQLLIEHHVLHASFSVEAMSSVLMLSTGGHVIPEGCNVGVEACEPDCCGVWGESVGSGKAMGLVTREPNDSSTTSVDSPFDEFENWLFSILETEGNLYEIWRIVAGR